MKTREEVDRAFNECAEALQPDRWAFLGTLGIDGDAFDAWSLADAMDSLDMIAAKVNAGEGPLPNVVASTLMTHTRMAFEVALWLVREGRIEVPR